MQNKKSNNINELTEILVRAIADKPELKQGLTALLGAGNTAPKKRLTVEQKRQQWREEFTRLAIKDEIKKRLKADQGFS